MKHFWWQEIKMINFGNYKMWAAYEVCDDYETGKQLYTGKSKIILKTTS